MLLLGFKLPCGKSVKYRYIEFFALTMIPFLFPFSQGLLFPLVALDKITIINNTTTASNKNDDKNNDKMSILPKVAFIRLTVSFILISAIIIIIIIIIIIVTITTTTTLVARMMILKNNDKCYE